jgi:flavin reductase ActVB
VTIERQAFFEVMASFPSGVAVVTTLDEGGLPRGLTTTAVCSVSANPPTILICVDLGSRTLAALRAGGRFVVNFMGEGRSELCLLFASKAEDKFANVSWRSTASGLPLLHEDVVAWAECATAHELEVGDHVLLVGRVEDGARPGVDPRDRGERSGPALAGCRDVARGGRSTAKLGLTVMSAGWDTRS